jgi:hypothetical protein
MNKEFTDTLMSKAREDLDKATSEGFNNEEIREELVSGLEAVFLGVIFKDLMRFSTPEGGMSYALGINDVIGALNTVLVDYKVEPLKLADFDNPIFSALVESAPAFDTIDDLVAQIEQDIKDSLH